MPYADAEKQTQFWKDNYQKNKEKKKAMARERYKERREEILAQKRERSKTEEFIQKRRKWQRKAYHTNPKFRQRHDASARADYYIKAKECELCGTKEKLQRHHPNYEKPLDVVVLCQPCHMKIHGKNYTKNSE